MHIFGEISKGKYSNCDIQNFVNCKIPKFLRTKLAFDVFSACKMYSNFYRFQMTLLMRFSRILHKLVTCILFHVVICLWIALLLPLKYYLRIWKYLREIPVADVAPFVLLLL